MKMIVAISFAISFGFYFLANDSETVVVNVEYIQIDNQILFPEI